MPELMVKLMPLRVGLESELGSELGLGLGPSRVVCES